MKLFSILQDLQQDLSSEINSSSKGIDGYFCSGVFFNLSWKVLMDTEMNFHEEG